MTVKIDSYPQMVMPPPAFDQAKTSDSKGDRRRMERANSGGGSDWVKENFPVIVDDKHYKLAG
jgi:hypothetical protein